MVDCPSCKYYENGECHPTIFPPDECDDYEESFEHHWERIKSIRSYLQEKWMNINVNWFTPVAMNEVVAVVGYQEDD